MTMSRKKNGESSIAYCKVDCGSNSYTYEDFDSHVFIDVYDVARTSPKGAGIILDFYQNGFFGPNHIEPLELINYIKNGEEMAAKKRQSEKEFQDKINLYAENISLFPEEEFELFFQGRYLQRHRPGGLYPRHSRYRLRG